jgi:hypothetical protein
MEFFVEGHSTLSGLIDGCSSSVTWEDGQPVARWDFQKPAYSHHAERPWQLRNQIGWVVTPPPTKRALPPLRMYHYFSNQRRYPTPDCVRKMAAAGADALVIHECWRSDVINGGVPHDPQALRAAIAAAHECGMRVALYVRGNEHAEVEEKTDWFPRLLERDRDGLYMDFGGACGLITPPNVDYVGGRIHFRGWYLAARERRGRVGDYGLVFAHTGPAFSAVGMTGGLVTGYISGEGERGLMTRSRRHHSFFSCSGVVPGTMWTAAFPEYGSPAMVPHLAATGQYPHVPLGTQWETSSLSHPDEPGTSDRHLRPLWRIWGLFAGERDVAVGTWDNGFAGVSTDSDLTGWYAMRARDGALLVVVSNFSPERRTAGVEADTAALGIPEGFKAYTMTPTTGGPGSVRAADDGTADATKRVPPASHTFDLPGYGVGALLFRVQGLFRERRLLAVHIEHGGRSADFSALRDTGNSLRDPVSGARVLIATPRAMKGILGESAALFESLDPVALQSLSPQLPELGGKLRLLPYAALGGGGLLPVFRPERILLDGRESRGLLVGISPRAGGEDFEGIV